MKIKYDNQFIPRCGYVELIQSRNAVRYTKVRKLEVRELSTKYDIVSTKYENVGCKYDNGIGSTIVCVESTISFLEVRLNVGSTRNGIHFINVTHYRSLFMFFVFGSAFASLILSALCLRSG